VSGVFKTLFQLMMSCPISNLLTIKLGSYPEYSPNFHHFGPKLSGDGRQISDPISQITLTS